MSNFNLQKNEFIANMLMSEALSPSEKSDIQKLLIGDPTEESYAKVFEIIDGATTRNLDMIEGSELDPEESQKLYMDYKVKIDQVEHDLDHELAQSEKEIEEAEEVIGE